MWTAAGSLGVALIAGELSGAGAAASPSPYAAASPYAMAEPTASASPTATDAPGGNAGASGGNTDAPWRRFDKRHFGNVCRAHTFYRIRSHRARNFWIPRTHYIDGPGGKMIVSVKRWYTVETQLRLGRSVEAEFKLEEFLHRARKEVEPQLTRSHTVETKHEYVRIVHKGKYGHIRYRVFGYHIGFQQWHRADDCGLRKVGSGVADVPTTVEGWRYWETDCPCV